MDLYTKGHRRGMAAAPHAGAAEAGRLVLAEGGNAYEAMVAMGAAITTVYPHMTHVGGDAFWLIREPNGVLRYIEACGFAGSRATRALYRDFETIPPRGPLAALTVPGLAGGYALALELSRAAGGKLPLDVLFGPAIRFAREGSPATRSQVALTTSKLSELKDAPGFLATFAPEGKPPALGQLMTQKTLADTFEHLTRSGLDDFYRGDVGHAIATDLEKIGSPVTRADLERYRAVLRHPLTVETSRGLIANAAPPTQGLASLIILALVDRLARPEPASTAYVHGLVEATKRAFLVRDRFVTDFDRLPHAPDRYLNPAFLDAEAAKIRPDRALPWPYRGEPGDTVWMGCADAEGRVVSYIQSIFFEFGSGCVLPQTGILMQNRGASFSLDPGAVNPLEPGRRPFHTLNPALTVLKDGRVMAYGTMGGEGQPQTQAMVYTRHVVHGMPLPEALDAPRWLLGRTWGTTHMNLRLENRFPDRVVTELDRMGHDVEVIAESHSDTMGHAGAVVLHKDGSLEGAHDPRADGGAAGV